MDDCKRRDVIDDLAIIPEWFWLKLTTVTKVWKDWWQRKDAKTWSPVRDPVYSSRSPSICLGSCKDVINHQIIHVHEILLTWMKISCQGVIHNVFLNVVFDWNFPQPIICSFYCMCGHVCLYITCSVNECCLEMRQSASTAVMEAIATTRLHIVATIKQKLHALLTASF